MLYSLITILVLLLAAPAWGRTAAVKQRALAVMSLRAVTRLPQTSPALPLIFSVWKYLEMTSHLI